MPATILLVEDEKLLRWALEQQLKRAGHTVLAAPDLVEVAPGDRADHAWHRGEAALAPEGVQRDVVGGAAWMLRRSDHAAEGGPVEPAQRAGVRLALLAGVTGVLLHPLAQVGDLPLPAVALAPGSAGSTSIGAVADLGGGVFSVKTESDRPPMPS